MTNFFPRRISPELFTNCVPQKAEGAGKAGCLTHPSLASEKLEGHEVVTTGLPERLGLPCANGFNGFLRALLVIGLSCHHPRAMRSIVAS